MSEVPINKSFFKIKIRVGGGGNGGGAKGLNLKSS